MEGFWYEGGEGRRNVGSKRGWVGERKRRRNEGAKRGKEERICVLE